MTLQGDPPATTKENQVIDELIELATTHADFVPLLEDSLNKAKAIADHDLEQQLEDALQWPTTFRGDDGYVAYLRWWAHWIPQQSSDPWWLHPGTPEHQEAYDRLCHFYFLIDQEVGPGGTLQDIEWFSEWLVRFAEAWGDFLDQPGSWTPEMTDEVRANSPWYRLEDSMIGDPLRPNAPSGWLTFNQFFARELNPGLRPIVEPTNNTFVTAPADCTYMEQFPIAADSTIPGIKVKGTHPVASIPELLECSGYANSFTNGQFVHYFLAPYSYHRFHTPVAGRVKECYPVQGKVFLDVEVGGGQFHAPDSAQGAYEFVQAHGIIVIDTAGSPYGDIGVVAVVPIGMCQVSGVNMTHTAERFGATSAPGRNEKIECAKGDEFGYFTFGGSDIIVLFQEGVDAQISVETNYHHYGSVIARCAPFSQR